MKKWIVVLLCILIIVIWQSIFTYKSAQDYLTNQHKKAISAAKGVESIMEVTDISTYHGTSSYSIIYSILSDDSERIICVPNKDNLEIITIDPEEGISKEEAIEIVRNNRNPLSILSVTIGVEQNVPIWEITYLDQQERYSYYYVTFKDGTFIKRYSL
ncbi:PepSY domain-containing protein [Bacillus salitolerans]|uniref:PepSY domain-containing protein n=1 Tax=Bacillus salitolerans TaxID=1437434 RepID=A0ABW4LUG9_9BACI